MFHKYIFLGLLAGIVTQIYAQPPCWQQPGVLNCSQGLVQHIYFRGIVNLNGTEVVKAFDVLGNCHLQHARLHWATIRGSSWLTNTIMHEKTRMVGNVHAQQTQFRQTVSITGDLDGHELEFQNAAYIAGEVVCQGCIFKKSSTLIGNASLKQVKSLESLTLNAPIIILEQSHIRAITVNESHPQQRQIIYLCHQSSLGDINFVSQQGIVIADQSSVITGRIHGGKLIRKDCLTD